MTAAEAADAAVELLVESAAGCRVVHALMDANVELRELDPQDREAARAVGAYLFSEDVAA